MPDHDEAPARLSDEAAARADRDEAPARPSDEAAARADRDEAPALLLVGHGSRSAEGVAAYWRFARVVNQLAPHLRLGCGFIELAGPDLDTAIDQLVSIGATSVVAVPLVLLGAGHMKNDGPSTLARARHRHSSVSFAYARALGVHPAPLAVAAERIETATEGWPRADSAVVLVGRGSSDPDANSDLFKVARMLWRGPGPQVVEAAFVSLAAPSVPEALERGRRLGARYLAVVPYFLFTGVLVRRIEAEARAWANEHLDLGVRVAPELGPHRRLAELVLERYHEARQGDTRMNCDCCAYRVALPGFEARVGAPVPGHHHPH